MSSNILQILQRLLVTAVTIMLALLVGATFVRVVRAPDAEALRRAELAAMTATTTTVAGGFAAPTTTTGAPAATPPPDGSETTTTEPGEQVNRSSCPEPDFPGGGTGTVLTIFYNCGPTVVPIAASYVYRTVPPTELVLTTTLAEMVKGPTDEERAAGYDSLFSSATANSFVGVEIVSGGQAVVNFTGLANVDGISNQERNVFLIADVNATVFQFDTVSGAEYRLDGDCDAFWQLLGYDGCRSITRSEWNRQISEWRGRG